MMFALAMGIATANAQENVTVETTNGSEELTLTKEVYPQKEADGDLYHGLTRKLGFDRMVPPHGLEVTYDKTVHVIFPAEVRYVDLGSPDLIAGKADGAENVIRVKATVRNFPNETNMSVITEDGSFYTFNVKYAAEPLLLNVEMCDFLGKENMFIFGMTAAQVEERKHAGGFSAHGDVAASHRLNDVLQAIRGGVFSSDDPSRYAGLVDSLTSYDRFLLCADFDAYWDAQRKVEETWHDADKWWRMAVLNTARMGWFSSDRTIREYAQDIWQALE